MWISQLGGSDLLSCHPWELWLGANGGGMGTRQCAQGSGGRVWLNITFSRASGAVSLL